MKTLLLLVVITLLAGCGDPNYVETPPSIVHACTPGERLISVAGDQSFCPENGVSPY